MLSLLKVLTLFVFRNFVTYKDFVPGVKRFSWYTINPFNVLIFFNCSLKLPAHSKDPSNFISPNLRHLRIPVCHLTWEPWIAYVLSRAMCYIPLNYFPTMWTTSSSHNIVFVTHEFAYKFHLNLSLNFQPREFYWNASCQVTKVERKVVVVPTIKETCVNLFLVSGLFQSPRSISFPFTLCSI